MTLVLLYRRVSRLDIHQNNISKRKFQDIDLEGSYISFLLYRRYVVRARFEVGKRLKKIVGSQTMEQSAAECLLIVRIRRGVNDRIPYICQRHAKK